MHDVNEISIQPTSSVVAETMKLLDDSSCGHQIMGRSRHTAAKFSNDGKTHSAMKSKLFKRVSHITDQLCKVKTVEPESEHREPVNIEFFYSTVC